LTDDYKLDRLENSTHLVNQQYFNRKLDVDFEL